MGRDFLANHCRRRRRRRRRLAPFQVALNHLSHQETAKKFVRNPKVSRRRKLGQTLPVAEVMEKIGRKAIKGANPSTDKPLTGQK